MRIKCLAQEQPGQVPARAQTWTNRSGAEHTNREAVVSSTNGTEKTGVSAGLNGHWDQMQTLY